MQDATTVRRSDLQRVGIVESFFAERAPLKETLWKQNRLPQ